MAKKSNGTKPEQKERVSVDMVLTDWVTKLMEEENTVAWFKTWSNPQGVPKNFVTGREYNRFNRLLLGCVGTYFLTANQIAYLDGERWDKDADGKPILMKRREWKIKIRKGSHGYPCVFTKSYVKHTGEFETVTDEATGEEVEREIVKTKWVDKLYTVYRVEDIEGLELPAVETTPFEPIAECEEFIRTCPCPIEYAGDQPCFIPSQNKIICPPRESFLKKGTRESFYTTLTHEMCHATGVKELLNRKGIVDPAGFGSEKYTYEELVVEIATARIAHELGIFTELEEKLSKAYIKGWSKSLKNNPSWIMPACSEAEKIFAFFMERLEELRNVA